MDDTLRILSEESKKVYQRDVEVEKLDSMGGGASGATAYLIKDMKGTPIGFIKIIKNQYNKGMKEFKNHELLMEAWRKSRMGPENSLFPIHKIDYLDKKTIYMMMNNILSPKKESEPPFFFDIKGNPGNKKIKDDFMLVSLGLTLEFNNLSMVYKRLKNDTKWLADNGIMDYSMSVAVPFKGFTLKCERVRLKLKNEIYMHVSDLFNKKKVSMDTYESLSMEPWTHKDLQLCIDLNYPSPFLDVGMKGELKKRYRSKQYSVGELKSYYQTIPKLIPILDMSYRDRTDKNSRSKFHIIDPSQRFVVIKKIQRKKGSNKKCSKCQRKSLLLNKCSVCEGSSCDPESYRLRFLNYFENITCKNSGVINCPKLCEIKGEKKTKKGKTKKGKTKKGKTKKKVLIEYFSIV